MRTAAALHSPRLDQGQFQFSFSTVTGWVYQVQYRDTLGLDYWHDVGFDSGTNAEATVTNPATATTGFYRVATEDPAL